MMIVSTNKAWSSGPVQLFPLDVTDVGDSYVSWLNDPELNRFLESRFTEHTLESTRAFVTGCRVGAGSLLLGVRCDWLGTQHVGNIKIEVNKYHRIGEIGILIGNKQVHGKGVATHAIKAMTMLARDELGLRKLSAGCYASNKGSERAFVKAGFTVEGVRPGHFLLDGRAEDLVLLGMSL
jgi:[ribosomal protein S5]-alanine N-acetyltransferase